MQGLGSDRKMITHLMFRLLPIQVSLAAIGTVNGIVSSYFASNYIGIAAMTAVGIYSPINIIIITASLIIVSGSSILCGKFMGQNEQEKMDTVFSTGIILSVLTGAVFSIIYILLAASGKTAFLAEDADVRVLFNSYLLGQSAGLIPFLVGGQLTFFLSIENKTRWSFSASMAYIFANLLLNLIFVKQLKMETLGLALASGLGMWVFLIVQASYYMTGKSIFHMKLSGLQWDIGKTIFRIGAPGALINAYQAVRGFIVNYILQIYVGSVAISAFAAANNILAIFWAIPNGMIAVSRMLISISIGEEDRQSLTDIMRVMFSRYIPVMCAITALIISFGEPLTGIFFKDPAQPVYMMCVWGIRLLPLCMPLAIVLTHFVTYFQASNRMRFVRISSALDGFIWVSLFTWILVPVIGLNGLYLANIINGIAGILLVIAHSWMQNKRIPRNMDELMVIPANFGVTQNDRMDLTIHSMEDVITLSKNIQEFCLERGVDGRRSYLAGLAMEEMAGNIVEYGFRKHPKAHRIDVRVSYKDGEVILRLRDDCAPFDPSAMKNITDENDPAKNIGIRMIFGILKSVDYQNILGLNVLLMKI